MSPFTTTSCPRMWIGFTVGLGRGGRVAVGATAGGKACWSQAGVLGRPGAGGQQQGQREQKPDD